MSEKPIAIDLCSGLGGWADGLEVEGWTVIRIDIVDMFAATGTPKPANCLLILQDILTFHGSQAKHCGLIVASPPCQEFSWMAMPWSRAKQVARALRGEDEFPANYQGSRTREQLTALFNACFRIQAEASLAAGRRIPMVVENVRGAQPWVGRARWMYGSFALWGDVPALMPSTKHIKVGGMKWYPPEDPRHVRGQGFNKIADRQCREAMKVPGFRFDGSGRNFQTTSVEGVKSVQDGLGGYGGNFGWNNTPLRRGNSKSPARKAASAMIAKIPEPLSRWIARCYYPQTTGSPA